MALRQEHRRSELYIRLLSWRRIAQHDFDAEEVEAVFAGNYKVRRARQKLPSPSARLSMAQRYDSYDYGARYGKQRAAAVPSKVGTLMKKKLPAARNALPSFQSDKEAATYFDTHSIADAWDQLPAAKQSKPSPALEQSIRKRHAAAKSPISIRLVPDQIVAAKKIAASKSVGYPTQLRMRIAEGIQREQKRDGPGTRSR